MLRIRQPRFRATLYASVPLPRRATRDLSPAMPSTLEHAPAAPGDPGAFPCDALHPGASPCGARPPWSVPLRCPPPRSVAVPARDHPGARPCRGGPRGSVFLRRVPPRSVPFRRPAIPERDPAVPGHPGARPPTQGRAGGGPSETRAPRSESVGPSLSVRVCNYRLLWFTIYKVRPGRVGVAEARSRPAVLEQGRLVRDWPSRGSGGSSGTGGLGAAEARPRPAVAAVRPDPIRHTPPRSRGEPSGAYVEWQAIRDTLLTPPQSRREPSGGRAGRRSASF